MDEQVDSENSTQDTLRKVQYYIESLGNISRLFTVCIRTIHDAESGRTQLPAGGAAEVAQKAAMPVISISPTMKTVFYSAAEHFYPEALKSLDALTMKNVLRLFDPAEIGGILGVTFLYKRLVKQLDPDEFERIRPLLLTHMEIASLVGSTLNYVGRGYGMFVGACRYIAIGTFAIRHLEAFKKYRRAAISKGKIFDVQLERELWGCNNLEITARIIQNLGYGIPAGYGANLAELDTKLVAKGPAKELSDAELCWRAALIWTEALHQTGEPPMGFDDESNELYLEPDSVKVLVEQVDEILANGSSFNWLLRKRLDLPEEVREALQILEVPKKRGALEEPEAAKEEPSE